jgi:hypothetical protein
VVLFPFGIAKMGGLFENAKHAAALKPLFFHLRRIFDSNKFIFSERKFHIDSKKVDFDSSTGQATYFNTYR